MGLKRHYRHDRIIEAFAAACRASPRPLILLLPVTLPKRAWKRMARQIHERGIQDQVRWLDELSYDRIPVLYALCDAVVNFPVDDGFPVSFLEAAAAGRPIITNRLPPTLSAGSRRI